MKNPTTIEETWGEKPKDLHLLEIRHANTGQSDYILTDQIVMMSIMEELCTAIGKLPPELNQVIASINTKATVSKILQQHGINTVPCFYSMILQNEV